MTMDRFLLSKGIAVLSHLLRRGNRNDEAGEALKQALDVTGSDSESGTVGSWILQLSIKVL